jgi:hypothetical protein
MILLRRKIRTAIVFVGFWIGSVVAEETPQVCWVSDFDSLRAAQRLVGPEAEADDRPITIHLASGDYLLTEPFHIARSRVSLVGEPGARLVLSDRVNRPVLAIGSQSEYPTADERIGWIEISGIESRWKLAEPGFGVQFGPTMDPEQRH